MRKTLATAVLGLAGFLGAAARSTGVPAPSPTTHPPPPSTTTPQPAPPTTPNGPQPSTRSPGYRRYRGGKWRAHRAGWRRQAGHLGELRPEHGVEPARRQPPTTASCDITHSDGSVGQTVTITFDSRGNPIADSTNVGTELLQPTGGRRRFVLRCVCSRRALKAAPSLGPKAFGQRVGPGEIPCRVGGSPRRHRPSRHAGRGALHLPERMLTRCAMTRWSPTW
jgi:hypothetical protein